MNSNHNRRVGRCFTWGVGACMALAVTAGTAVAQQNQRDYSRDQQMRSQQTRNQMNNQQMRNQDREALRIVGEDLRVKQPSLGLQAQQSQDGLHVRRVKSGGLAEISGLRPGDIIVRIGDQEANPDMLRRHLSQKSRSGDELKLVVVRNDQVRTVMIDPMQSQSQRTANRGFRQPRQSDFERFDMANVQQPGPYSTYQPSRGMQTDSRIYGRNDTDNRRSDFWNRYAENENIANLQHPGPYNIYRPTRPSVPGRDYYGMDRDYDASYDTRDYSRTRDFNTGVSRGENLFFENRFPDARDYDSMERERRYRTRELDRMRSNPNIDRDARYNYDYDASRTGGDFWERYAENENIPNVNHPGPYNIYRPTQPSVPQRDPNYRYRNTNPNR